MHTQRTVTVDFIAILQVKCTATALPMAGQTHLSHMKMRVATLSTRHSTFLERLVVTHIYTNISNMKHNFGAQKHTIWHYQKSILSCTDISNEVVAKLNSCQLKEFYMTITIISMHANMQLNRYRSL